MIDCQDKAQQQQQQATAHQYWLQQLSAQPGPGQRAGEPSVQLFNSCQVIHQQAALHCQPHSHYQQQKRATNDLDTPLLCPVQSLAGGLQQPGSTSIDRNGSNNLNNNNNELIGYYFGSISRDTAEWILRNHGGQLDGAYLLRSSGPADDFVLSLMVVHEPAVADGHQIVDYNQQVASVKRDGQPSCVRHSEVLHYKIVETDDSFVALHGQVGDEKFATIDELIEKAQGVATKPKWPIQRHSLECQILPPTFWGLSVDQVRLAILITAKRWGFPSSIFQQAGSASPNGPGASCYRGTEASQQTCNNLETGVGYHTESLNGSDSVSQANAARNHGGSTAATTTLNNETIRTLIYKSLHEFQPWFHGKISREDAERRIEDGQPRDGRFLVRERDNYSYAMCITHKKTTKHYRIDVLPTGELAIQDGRKFTSLMALISHYTIMSDGLWCALTEPCPRPIQQAVLAAPAQPAFAGAAGWCPANQIAHSSYAANQCLPAAGQTCSKNIYCIPPPPPTFAPCNGAAALSNGNDFAAHTHRATGAKNAPLAHGDNAGSNPRDQGHRSGDRHKQQAAAADDRCPDQGGAVLSVRAPLKEWLHSMNNKWSQLAQMAQSKTRAQSQSFNAFLFGPSNPLNNHCHHHRNHHHHHRHNHPDHQVRRKCTGGDSCARSQGKTASSASDSQRHSKKIATNTQHRHKTPAATVALSSGGGPCECCSQSSNGVTKMAVQDTAHQQQRQQNSLQIAALQDRVQLPLSEQLLVSAASSGLGQSSTFIGSPLFAVRAQNSRGSPIEGMLSSASLYNGNGATCASVRSIGNGSFAPSNMTTQEVRLISPAQSVTAILDNYPSAAKPGHGATPYALSNTDIYGGSQTSTALVNDQMNLTSSSSSSGNNNPSNSSQRRQSSIEAPALRAQSAMLAPSKVQLQRYGAPTNGALHRQDVGSNQQEAKNVLPLRNGSKPYTGGNLPAPGPQMSMPPARQQQQQQQQVAAMPPSQPPASGPAAIFCGQHAGPAYRYSNCPANGQSPVGACYHTSRLQRGSAAMHPRALDDSQLMTQSSQLGGPAALSKFVQFQDGQCLRTHRDTKSIQMAYNLSCQEALNALNSRNSNNKSSSRMGHGGYPNGYLNDGAATRQHQAPDNRMLPLHGATNLFAANYQQQQHSARQANISNSQQQQQQRRHNTDKEQAADDFDLMDWEDGKAGFQFRYDPKLIKASSIETLCGAEDDAPDDDCLEALNNFKTHSELLMSLKSCWPSYPTSNGQQQQTSFSDILSPVILGGASDEQRDDTLNTQQAGQLQQTGCNSNSDRGPARTDDSISLLLNLGAESGLEFSNSSNQESSGRLDESVRKQHDLDDLTTTLLAELTASLKAQVDLKNKRSGLCNTADHTAQAGHQAPSHNDGQQSTNNHGPIGERDPRDLISEFDTLALNRSN